MPLKRTPLLPSVLATLFLVIPFQTSAQNTVVVVPIGGEDPSQFRIVSHQTGSDTGGFTGPSEANQGRLEYTLDSSPGPDSLWGTICDDNIATPFADASTTVLQSGDDFANLACKDLGYGGGNLIPSSFTVDGALVNEFGVNFDLSLFPTGSCNSFEDVGVDCHITEEVTFRPQVEMPCVSAFAFSAGQGANVQELPGGKVDVVADLAPTLQFNMDQDGFGNVSASIVAQGLAGVFTLPTGSCVPPAFALFDDTFFVADGEDWIITDTDLSSDGTSIFFNSVTFSRRPFADI